MLDASPGVKQRIVKPLQLQCVLTSPSFLIHITVVLCLFGQLLYSRSAPIAEPVAHAITSMI